MYLSADDILNKDDLIIIDVDVPEWGGLVKVRMLSGVERDRWESEQQARIGEVSRNTKITGEIMMRMRQNLRARFCALVMVNEKNERLFTDDQALALGNKSSSAIERVFEAASKLNKMTDGDLDDTIKNSNPGQGEGST